MDITAQVRAFYNRYPYPPEPLLDMPPLGWNWRWDWRTVHTLYYGYLPPANAIQILDAGCGTGFGTQYLAYQNPHAQVLGVDLSEEALAVAQERCRRAEVTGVALQRQSLTELTGSYDFINCVGVLHHLPDPLAGLRVLRECLVDGGLMHLFVYSEMGRWEIGLMQEALRLLKPQDVTEGVSLGRAVFAALPLDNRLRTFEKERWADENREDSSFADMYLQVQETRYNVVTLFELLDAAGLTFLGFSNPEFWQLERLLGKQPELLEKTAQLTKLERYRLIELLDPTPNHYELFVSTAPIQRWEPSDAELIACIPHRSPYIGRWPSLQVFTYCYQEYTLTEEGLAFLSACDGMQTVGELTSNLVLVRDLAQGLLIYLQR
jgi:SAM-dependent methyltransferase